ncbi:MliC family protein [Acetobacter indonesiensis]|uniref:MliC family protein n=1 Tax=Acetobacter indonesiensis TaxID=104101 RepID=UPI0039E7E225
MTMLSRYTVCLAAMTGLSLSISLAANTYAQGRGKIGSSTVLEVPLNPAVPVEKSVTVYRCHGPKDLLSRLPAATVRVTYINAGEASLAVLPIEGHTLVFANVISGSGAKYVADRFVWWSKGNTAYFSEDRQDITAQVMCNEVPRIVPVGQ